MDAVINKIEKIQNKQKSLMWGHHNMSDDETMFAVGNKAYPQEPHFFIVTSQHVIYLINESHKKYEFAHYDDINEVTSGVISLLKSWFPAK